MIFIAVGTQKFQFDRLFKIIDELIEEKKINDEVFAQIGFSDYEPKNYKYEKFLCQQDFEEKIRDCDFLIVHGGVGSLLYGLYNKKKIIAFPRLAAYGEHVDDHQVEIVTKFESLNYILACKEKQSLERCLSEISGFESEFVPKECTDNVADYILNYLNQPKKTGKSKK